MPKRELASETAENVPTLCKIAEQKNEKKDVEQGGAAQTGRHQASDDIASGKDRQRQQKYETESEDEALHHQSSGQLAAEETLRPEQQD